MKKLLSLLVILLATGTVGLFSMDQYGAEGALSREHAEAIERERLRLEREEEHRRFLEIERRRRERYEAVRRQQPEEARARRQAEEQQQGQDARRKLNF
jgi:hypothetical protein